MSDTYVGRRVSPEDIMHPVGPNGAWAKVPEDWPHYRIGARWFVRYGMLGTLREGVHSVTEHEDGTITVEPSLVMPCDRGIERWHGLLRRGVFTGSFEPCAQPHWGTVPGRV